MAITWGSGGVFASIGKAIKEANADSVSPNQIIASAVAFIRAYITYNFRWLADLTFTSFDDLYWDGIVAKMITEVESVQKNTVSIPAPAFTGDATAVIEDASGYPVPGQVTPTQMLLNNDTFRIVCTSASVGQDQWAVYSMIRGRLAGTCITGELYGEEYTSADKAGITFTIQEPSAGAYAVGDYFLIGPATVTDAGVIQTFFRDKLSRTLPYSASPSIADSLAT